MKKDRAYFGDIRNKENTASLSYENNNKKGRVSQNKELKKGREEIEAQTKLGLDKSILEHNLFICYLLIQLREP